MMSWNTILHHLLPSMHGLHLESVFCCAQLATLMTASLNEQHFARRFHGLACEGIKQLHLCIQEYLDPLEGQAPILCMPCERR